MKNLLIIIAFLFSINAFTQNSKTYNVVKYIPCYYNSVSEKYDNCLDEQKGSILFKSIEIKPNVEVSLKMKTPNENITEITKQWNKSDVEYFSKEGEKFILYSLVDYQDKEGVQSVIVVMNEDYTPYETIVYLKNENTKMIFRLLY